MHFFFNSNPYVLDNDLIEIEIINTANLTLLHTRLNLSNVHVDFF